MIEGPPLYIEMGVISTPLSIVRDISAFDPEYLFHGPGFRMGFFVCLILFALLDMELEAFWNHVHCSIYHRLVRVSVSWLVLLDVLGCLCVCCRRILRGVFVCSSAL